MRKSQSHRGFRPGRDYLPGLWPGPVSEPHESRTRMESLHERGKGRERTSRDTNILLHPRQRTLNGYRPSQQGRFRETTTLRDKNGNAPSSKMADPDPSTLVIRPQPSPSNGRAGPFNGQTARTSQRQRRLSRRIPKGFG